MEHDIKKDFTQIKPKILVLCILNYALAGIIASIFATCLAMIFKYEYVSVLVVGVLINIGIICWMVYRLYDFRKSIHGKDKYYIYNVTAMGIYCFVAVFFALLLCFIKDRYSVVFEIYTFLFYNFKLLRYIIDESLGTDLVATLTLLSALIMSVFYIVTVFIVPHYVRKKKPEKINEKLDDVVAKKKREKPISLVVEMGDRDITAEDLALQNELALEKELAKKEEVEVVEDDNATWTCINCGKTDLQTKYCPDCGTAKIDSVGSWNCPNCGKEHLKTKFCPDCGTKRITHKYY